MRSWYGRGSVALRSWYGRGAVMVRSRYGHDAVMERLQCGRVMILFRYAPGSLVVRHAQGSFTPAILACTRLEPCTCTIRSIVHSTVVVWSRYSLGMFPVRSWYGTLKVRSRLVFSTCLEPGTRIYCTFYCSRCTIAA